MKKSTGARAKTKKEKRLRILLADDNPKFRDKATAFLSRYADLIVIEETGDGDTTLELARGLQPDVILYDLRMPGTLWTKVFPRLREQVPDAKIIVVSLIDEAGYVETALAVGAHGFVSKTRFTTDLVPLIRQLTSAT